MPENFLSFISNVDAKTADASVSDNASPTEKASQGAEFNSILVKEQAKVQGGSRAEDVVSQGREQALAPPELAHGEKRSDLPPNPEAPVALPTGPVSGNPLPELSIHSAALKVGRVILTTANPKVSEESLSHFARSQGADVPSLMSGASDETATNMPQRPNTQNILQGLMGGLEQPRTGHPDQPRAAKEPESSATKQSLGPESALDSRLQFDPRTGLSQANLADTKNVLPAVGLPLNKSMNALPTQQPIADVSGAAAKGVDTRRPASELPQQPIFDVSGAAAKAVGMQNVPSKYQPNPSGSAEFTADKLLNEEKTEAKSGSISAHMALGGIDVEKPVPLLADGAQDQLPQQNQSQSFSAPAPTPVNTQGGLIQAPVTNIPISLADALMSSDPAQMQSRLQPYQAWTQRFGEVLAQKLAMAVKDGNWSVKLKLNPASLGPVGVDLQVREGGIEGQIAASDPNVRQLLGDSMPKLRQSLEALVGEQGGVNIELGDGRDRGANSGNEQEIELSMDLLADEFVPSQQDMASGNILRDGLNVFV